MRKIKFIFIASFILISFYSCDESIETFESESEYKIDPTDPVYQSIINAGFLPKHIQSSKDYYIVEGDILFSKDREVPNQESPKNGKTQQYRTEFVISRSHQQDIDVFINPNTNQWAASAVDAVNNWNALPNTNLSFNIVNNAANADIIIEADIDAVIGLTWDGQFNPDALACADFPSNNRPGEIISVDDELFNCDGVINPQQYTTVLQHEIGHAIGLRHGNAPDEDAVSGEVSYHINGTPVGNDPQSIMNGGCPIVVRGFSNFDIVAVQTLYPVNSPGDRLFENEQLFREETITSSDGRFTLKLQGDGNLVLRNDVGTAIWSSGTYGTPVTRALMQVDGNFVLYDSNNTPYWSTGTYNYPGSHLVVQSDGNLVVYHDAFPRWESGTCCQ